MKYKDTLPDQITLVLFSTLLICTVLFDGCKAAAEFKTPNDTGKSEATVYFFDGTVKKGVLSVVFENQDPNMNHIYFIPANSTTAETLDYRTIKSYSIDGDVYVPKLVDIYVNDRKLYLFVKRLTTENARLQLFELHQLFKSSDSGEENFEYFISKLGSGVYDAVNINSSQLFPFEKAMEAYVMGCPSLLQKVLRKQKGYYYSFSTFKTKRIEVMKRIVEEYNNCK
ncbi:MAG: hypothetical protein ACXVBJ_11300 [Flavisolibacter sp.]